MKGDERTGEERVGDGIRGKKEETERNKRKEWKAGKEEGVKGTKQKKEERMEGRKK